ncbi:DUF1918 domain-containing protein [Streptomyces similanensis]
MGTACVGEVGSPARHTRKETRVNASVGDRYWVSHDGSGKEGRMVEILGVLGANGQPPYRVRGEDGVEAILSPGPDCVFERADRPERSGRFEE